MSCEPSIRLELPASLRYLNVLGACISAAVERIEGVEEPAILSYNLQLAADEIFTNIVEHGYEGDERCFVRVSVTVAPEPRRVVVQLCDSAPSFDPAAVPAPNLDDAQEHGYGLFLVQQLMDEVVYQPGEGQNSWTLVKHL
jgi:serine/threonine-protein kinase RsbW